MARKQFLFLTFQAYKTILIFVFQPYYLILTQAVTTPIYSPFTLLTGPTVIAPYSVLWYSFYQFYRNYMLGNLLMLSLDAVFGYVVLLHQSRFYFAEYQIISSFFLYESPGNLLTFFTIIISYQSPFLLVIAPLTYLPWNGPLWVWEYVFSQHSLYNPVNWPRYGILGLLWVQSLAKMLNTRWKMNRATFKGMKC